VESPYNTYLVNGLPPGPICSPGRACLEAALYPAETNFIYFVVEDIPSGRHYFTHSYNDFLAARARYLAQLGN
jgi:UPF0755 protein